MTFIVATGNCHKLCEIRRILGQYGAVAVSSAEAGICFKAEETGSTFEENALIKALAVSRAASMPCIADDSGLEVEWLDGAPGVYSARYAGEGATDMDRINKLLSALEGVPAEKRSARFVCSICCVFPDGRIFTVKGICQGSIALEGRGTKGFGYDPIFIERSTGKSFGILSDAEKDAVSHRGKALAAFAEKLPEFLNINGGSD